MTSPPFDPEEEKPTEWPWTAIALGLGVWTTTLHFFLSGAAIETTRFRDVPSLAWGLTVVALLFATGKAWQRKSHRPRGPGDPWNLGGILLACAWLVLLGVYHPISTLLVYGLGYGLWGLRATVRWCKLDTRATRTTFDLITLGVVIVAMLYRTSIGVRRPGHFLEAATYVFRIDAMVTLESLKKGPDLTISEPQREPDARHERAREDAAATPAHLRQTMDAERRLALGVARYVLLPEQSLVTPNEIRHLCLRDGPLRIHPGRWAFAACSVRDLDDEYCSSVRWRRAGFHWDGKVQIHSDR